MIKIYGEKYEKIIKEIAERTLEKFGNTESDAEVEITVCGEEEIKELNKEKRGIDKVTDVLSFQNLEKIKLPLNAEDYPTDINPEDGSVIIGEIFICEKKVSEQAEEYGHSEEREVAFLTCHGMLHLLGFDHNDKKSEEEMNGLCEEIITNAGYMRGEGKQEKTTDDADKNYCEEETKAETGKDFRSGFVAIMGRPNAGKSTLINTIVGEKVAIVSWKPQTTRNKILGVYNKPDRQIIFIDTPGLHKPRNALGEYMMKSAKTAYEGVDCVLYVIDAEKGYDDNDKRHILSFINGGEKVIVAVNKTDHVTKEKVFGILTELNKLQKLVAVVPISALRKRNIEPLIEEISKLLSDNIKYYDDDQYTDKNMRFMASEIIREKALRLLDKEVPYGIGVDITEYSIREDGIININADIICEKAAHKPIILGKGGSMLKKIATYARQDIEGITGNKVFLTVFVKVRDEWRGSTSIMKELGYDTKNPD